MMCGVGRGVKYFARWNKRKVYKMTLSLSCLVTLSYSLSHSFSCAGFYKFVVIKSWLEIQHLVQ